MHAYIIHDNNVCEGLTWTWCWWQKFCREEQIGALQMHISMTTQNLPTQSLQLQLQLQHQGPNSVSVSVSVIDCSSWAWTFYLFDCANAWLVLMETSAAAEVAWGWREDWSASIQRWRWWLSAPTATDAVAHHFHGQSQASVCSIAFLFTSEHTPPYLPLTGETQTLRHGK